MARWKIFIEWGEQEEFRVLDEKVFETRKQAENFCKENPLGYHYPLKCVMHEDEWQRRYEKRLEKEKEREERIAEKKKWLN